MRYGPIMSSNQPSVPAEEDAAKDEAVLEREGLEGELMDKGLSEEGEHIADAEEERTT